MISYRHRVIDVSPFYTPFHLCPFAPSQSHSLAILLEFRDELIALLDHIIVLLVLVIRSIRLDDTLASHSVDRAWNSLSCNKLSEIPGR